MKLGRRQLVAGLLVAGTAAGSWLATDLGGEGLGTAVQTVAVLGAILLVAGLQRREHRRLTAKSDTFRTKAQRQLDLMTEQLSRLDGMAQRLDRLDGLTEQVNGVSQQVGRVSGQVDEMHKARSAEPSPGAGVPQEHFEQLARLLAANNERLESAVDDLARRLGEAEAEADGDSAGKQRPAGA